MDDLKNRIWDHLFRVGEARTCAMIADELDEPINKIVDTVDDPWFHVQGDLVAIATNVG